MGDQKNPGTMPMSLPPGCRFYPSEEQLLHYLIQKNNTNVISDSSTINNNDQYFGVDVIKEINLYGYDPFDLPDTTCFRFGRGGRKRHWYCYTARAAEERGIKRKTAGGYWKRKGQSQLVVRHDGKVVAGTKSSYVFYFRKSPRCVERTDWMMKEYDLVDHPKVCSVLCRVYIKSRRGNTSSENVLSSCGEESVARVRHIGIQHDGITIGRQPVRNEDKNSIDRDGLLAEPISNAISPFPSATQPIDMLRSSGFTGDALSIDTTQRLMFFIEEDYIELDDLISPLSGE